MEQMVWVYFGIIAILIALGIVANVLIKYRTESRMTDFKESLEKLKSKCDFVCSTPRNTRLGEKVVLPSGIVIAAAQKKICGDYETEKKCVACICQIDAYTLDLNTTLARQSFDTHEYTCFFTRGMDNVTMECQG